MRPERRSRWQRPPAISHGAEAFEGLTILEEVNGQLGFLLWQIARDVTLWATVPPESRSELFEPGSEATLPGLVRATEVEAQLEPPLMTLVRMAGAPDSARPEEVALACRHIELWADEHGYGATAVAFAQAAAMTVPFDAGAAYAVGRLARRRTEYSRAETWFRRSIALARQSGDWSSYALAFSGLGNLYMQRGSIPTARRFHLRALKAARRHSLRSIQGAAQHDLFVIAAGHNHVDEAERYARTAFESYGPDHPRLPVLLHDIACFWTEHGDFASALNVFEALLPYMTRHEDRLMARANIARTAAGVGERKQFDQRWAEVWDSLIRNEGVENAAEALLELARGAVQLGEVVGAVIAAERAAMIAHDRGQTRVLRAAEALLDSLRPPAPE